MNMELKKAVEDLDKATNSTLISYGDIAKAFSEMHPYLLNQLMLGLLKVCTYPIRQGDGRIDARVQKLALEVWG